jgi:2-octaprenyl-6-methoxyphenol hydroxylase
MNVCIIGDGLSSLSLAKNLINKKINVHIYQKKIRKNLSLSRTIGISENNIKFFKEQILEIPKKITWEIKKIEIYSEKLKKNRILKFENNKKNLFHMVKNNELYEFLNYKLLKSKFFKKIIIKNKNFYDKLVKKNEYDLIINCEENNPISKKYFIKKINKNYKNIAYTTILEHEKIKNNSAIQVFTDSGPIAFLPVSNRKTSVVCSLDIQNNIYSNIEVLNLIKKHNPKFKIKKILKLSSFKLKSSNLRNYYHKNILAFGDMLHRIHPLAGQGFNMTIRDIKELSKIIQDRIGLGLQLDNFILDKFQKKTKNKNFIFSSGIDFIYEFFNFEKKSSGKNFHKVLRYLGANKSFMNSIINFADKGLNI